MRNHSMSTLAAPDGADKRRAGVAAGDGCRDGFQVGGRLLHPPHLPRPPGGQVYPLPRLRTQGHCRQEIVSSPHKVMFHAIFNCQKLLFT